MGAFMAEHGIAPELILCSPSVRTRQTLDLVLPHLRRRPTVVYEDALLSWRGLARCWQRVRKVEAKVRHVMIVGHDPGMHGLAIELAGLRRPGLLQTLAAKFPTAALAVIVFEGRSWSKVKPGTGRLELFMTPKRLP